MKILNIYKQYKDKYPKYIILIKVGNFYAVYCEEAYIMFNLFNYNVKETNDTIRVGFPFVSYNKVTNKLNVFKINYLVYDKGEVVKKKFNKNNYDSYILNDLNIDDRIRRIYERLSIIKNTPKINDLLERLEDII